MKATALRAGFHSVGVARAEPVDPVRLERWLSLGYQGEMHYLERNLEKRLDPRLVLPGTRSLLCLTLEYGAEHRTEFSDPRMGRVARYARGRDYHQVMERRLKTLWRRLQLSLPGTESRWYVDTGPVLEKYWAAQAGLGWQGKHSTLVSRRQGSWFFLGVMLLTAELEPDAPAPNFCGTCTRCLDACPTGAVVAPYVVDSRRCISYLTIELKQSIATELRGDMANWIFGCDICQEVCPWNRRAAWEGDPAFKDSGRNYDLVRLARLGPDEFSEEFRGTPVRRSKWEGFLRNVAVALGNSGLIEAMGILERLARGEGMVAEHARWAVGRLGSA